MRMLALPAATLLGALLYACIPSAAQRLTEALAALHEAARRLFTTKQGKTDERAALAVYLLALAAAAILLCALHPAVCAVLGAPLMTAFSRLSAWNEAKRTLDSGALSGDIPRYEQQVMDAVGQMGGDFSRGLFAPMILCALGIALHLGCAPGWVYMGLCAAHALPAAERILSFIRGAADALLRGTLRLCAGLCGRSFLQVKGGSTDEMLADVLGLGKERSRAPVAGDISLGAAMCCVCCGLWLAAITIAGAFIL